MTIRLAAALAAILVLAACGGGGSVSVEDIRTGTGSQPPTETVADISARIANIISRTDSLVISTLYGETTRPDLPTTRLRASCSGTVCNFYVPQVGLVTSLSLNDLGGDTSRSEAVLSKHGITLLDTRTEAGTATDRSYTSVMDHSAFSAESSRVVVGDTTVWGRGSLAGGDLTSSRPGGSATYRGIMVGVPADASGRTNFLQGDAALTYDFSGSLDASFTGIRNITRNRAHSVTSVRFDDIPVSSRGTFQAGAIGNRIQGGFYGPGHAETAGVFEQQGIVGSFGAKR